MPTRWLLPIVPGTIAVAAATLAPTALAQRTMASGIVFEDRNADGIMQATEPGLAGVVVSDGEQVTQTDADGRYSLMIDARDAIVFVVKPAGFQVPLDEQNKPRHYYIHKPGGSLDEGFLFPGVEPTGPLPRSIDFPLVSTNEPEEFSVVLFGDPQPYSQEQVGYFRNEVIEPLIGHREASFGVSLGDLVGDHLDLFEPLNEAQGLLGVPWYNVYGNHDMNFRSGSTAATQDDPDKHADETFTRVYGPANYAFQYGRAHFIVLDNVIHEGSKGDRDGTAEGWPNNARPVTSTYRGGLRPEQIRFVDNYLDTVPTDDLVVLMFHIPIEMDGEGVHRIPEKGELFAALSSHPRTLSISGHTHIQRHWFFGSSDGYAPNTSAPGQLQAMWPDRFDGPVHHHINAVTASGSWFRGPKDETGVPFSTMACGAPNGYTLLHIDGNEYRSEFRAARFPAEYQMNLSIADTNTFGESLVFANVFNGAIGDAVEYRVVSPGGSTTAWKPMDYAPLPDPTMSTLWREHSKIPDEFRTERPLPRPQISTHLWSAQIALPDAGTSVIEVRHTDLYGHANTQRLTFRPKTTDLP